MKVWCVLNPRKSPGYLSVFVARRTISDLLFIFCALLAISQSRWKPSLFLYKRPLLHYSLPTRPSLSALSRCLELFWGESTSFQKALARSSKDIALISTANVYRKFSRVDVGFAKGVFLSSDPYIYLLWQNVRLGESQIDS